MKNNYNVERISRKGEAYQWTGENTENILGFLARHEMIGELYRDGAHILVRYDNCIYNSINHGTWVLEGEDGKIRFYDDETFKLMYRPIDDELERLRAYMLDTLIHGYSAHDAGVKHGFMVFNGEAIG